MAAVGVFDLSNRTKMRFSGPQALWFVDQLVTNQVLDLPTGRCADALLLTPKGRLQAILRIASTPDGALVDFQEGELEDVVDFFSRRVFATKVEVSDVTRDFRLWRVTGDPGTVFAAVGAAFEAGADDQNQVFDGGLATVAPRPFSGVDLWIDPAAAHRVRSMLEERLQAVTLDGSEYEAIRITAGLPSFAEDLAGGFLPQEGALERAVHFKKGCYLGQEAVAMTQRGRVKKRLRHLEFSGPAARGEVRFEEQPAGTVTSAAGGWGIGMVATTVEVGAEVTVVSGGIAGSARVRTLPATVEGPSVPSARELRERLNRSAQQ